MDKLLVSCSGDSMSSFSSGIDEAYRKKGYIVISMEKRLSDE